MNSRKENIFHKRLNIVVTVGICSLFIFSLTHEVNSQRRIREDKPASTSKPIILTLEPPPGATIIDSEEDGFEIITEETSKNKAPEGEILQTDAEIPATKIVVHAKHPEKLEKLRESITEDLSESTGKDWGDLSAAILNAAWAHNGNKTEISVLQLMQWFENVGGEERLHLLRILELMDKNMNGLIGKDEFVSLYAGPMASPEKAIELLHRVNDYDGNGLISVWESLTQVLTVDGINRNIFDKYQEAAYNNRIKDTNRDLSVSLHEFTHYIVWQMNKGIGGKESAFSLFSG